MSEAGGNDGAPAKGSGLERAGTVDEAPCVTLPWMGSLHEAASLRYVGRERLRVP